MKTGCAAFTPTIGKRPRNCFGTRSRAASATTTCAIESSGRATARCAGFLCGPTSSVMQKAKQSVWSARIRMSPIRSTRKRRCAKAKRNFAHWRKLSRITSGLRGLMDCSTGSIRVFTNTRAPRSVNSTAINGAPSFIPTTCLPLSLLGRIRSRPATPMKPNFVSGVQTVTSAGSSRVPCRPATNSVKSCAGSAPIPMFTTRRLSLPNLRH